MPVRFKGGGGHGMSNSVKDPARPCVNLRGSLLHHPVVHITILGFPCAVKPYCSLNDTFCSAMENQLCCLSVRTFRGALAMWQGTTHHTWSRIESPDSSNDSPFGQSWIPIVQANRDRARLMLSLCSVTGIKDAPVQALGAHP